MAGKKLKEVVSFLSKTETTQSEKIPSRKLIYLWCRKRMRLVPIAAAII